MLSRCTVLFKVGSRSKRKVSSGDQGAWCEHSDPCRLTAEYGLCMLHSHTPGFGVASYAGLVSSAFLFLPPRSSSAASTSLSNTILRYLSSAAVFALTMRIMYVPQTTELLI